jgi:hypothetical protein
MNIQDHPVIKELDKHLAGPYGDVLRLNPNAACELTYDLLKGDPEWVARSFEFSKYIYKRLWIDAKKEQVYNKRYR